MSKKYFRIFAIIIFVLLSYGNTLTLDYALDDRLVIFENDYTLKGKDGIKDVLTKDSFSGYFGHTKNLVAGGRYRPLAQISFILEYELFGNEIKDEVGFNRDPKNEELFNSTYLPLISHFVNLLLYTLLCILVFHTLKIILKKWDHEKWYLSIPFLATLLFAVHPIHTEAVANIKGRDEIMSMLGAFIALYTSIRYINTKKWYFLILSFFGMLFGLFSKENAITFLAIIPLSIYFLNDNKKGSDYWITLIPLAIASIIFLYVRSKVLGAFMAEEVNPNILNNPFVFATPYEKIATVILTWGIYLKLMVFPYPLTHDYYPHQIELTNFANPYVLFLILLLFVIIFYSIKWIRNKSVFSYAILFFIITFSITSNLLFSVGTFMNERFVFVPLLGFTILFAFGIQLLVQKFSKSTKSFPIILIFPILILYTGKTFARNFTWKNDITLFTTDVLVSSNSIKCNVSAGGSYIRLFKEEKKERYLKESLKYLDKALKLDPTSINAQLLLGEYYFLKKDYNNSYQIYQNIVKSDPTNALAAQNVQIVLTKWKGDQLNEIGDMIVKGKIQEAFSAVNNILLENPQNPDAIGLKGKIFGQGLQKMDSARFYFNKALAINPNHVVSLENMGVSYAIEGKLEIALQYLERAQKLNPTSETIHKNIEMIKKSMLDSE